MKNREAVHRTPPERVSGQSILQLVSGTWYNWMILVRRVTEANLPPVDPLLWQSELMSLVKFTEFVGTEGDR